MAIIQSDYLQCKCGSDTFTEEVKLQFHKGTKSRGFTTSFPLQPANKEYIYRCTECKETLGK